MIHSYFQIHPGILQAGRRAEQEIQPAFERIEEIQRYNQEKILAAFSKAGVSESHFVATTGYGYHDRGRELLDQLFAQAFGAEDALVRHSFASGTHTLTVALFGILRPGDKMLCVTGSPYDTLQGVIGHRKKSSGSLTDFGIRYEELDLLPNGMPDLQAISEKLNDSYRMIYLQRSRGYQLRPSYRTETLGEVIALVRKKAPHAVILVDNCYGEFVEKEEPLAYGADLIAGSLIKNPGGGIAPAGGYIAGKAAYVEQCAYRLTTPATGKEIGASLGQNRELFMGIFHAPHVVGEAMKTAAFAAALFSGLGYRVTPAALEPRADIIQTILLESPEGLVSFCRGIQKGAPIDSFVTPVPDAMPGYDSEVIMAAGAFTQGGSVELSADAPLRPPYAAWLQGGLNFHSGRVGVLLAAEQMRQDGVLKEGNLYHD